MVVYALVVSCGLEVYLFQRFGNLVIAYAKYDFTAKMISIIWIILCYWMPFFCLKWFIDAIEFIKQQVPAKNHAEVSSASESNSADSKVTDDASWNTGLTEQQTEGSDSGNEAWIDLHKEKTPRSPDEQRTTMLPVPVEFLEFMFGIGNLALLYPLLRLPFA